LIEQTSKFCLSGVPAWSRWCLDLSEGQQPTELELYYPLTPKLALLMDFDNSQCSEQRPLTEEEVRIYNGKIVAEAEEQCFAASEGDLKNVFVEKPA
jgi:hypothetical protein